MAVIHFDNTAVERQAHARVCENGVKMFAKTIIRTMKSFVDASVTRNLI